MGVWNRRERGMVWGGEIMVRWEVEEGFLLIWFFFTPAPEKTKKERKKEIWRLDGENLAQLILQKRKNFT